MERLKNRRNEIAVGMIAAVALSSCGVEGMPDIATNESNVPVYYFPDDCPFEPENVNQVNHFQKQEKKVNHDYADSHTAVDGFEFTLGVARNLIDSANYFRRDEFVTTAEFEVQATGVQIEVMTDSKSVHVDEEAFEELIMLPYELADHIVNPRLKRKLQCHREAAVDERAFEDEHVTYYIPSDPTLCFAKDRSISHKPDENCQFTGISLPAWGTEQDLFQPIELSVPHLAITLTSTTDMEDASKIVATNILHEYSHVIDWMDGAPFRFKKMERYADSAVDNVKDAALKQGIDIPQPITWTE